MKSSKNIITLSLVLALFSLGSAMAGQDENVSADLEKLNELFETRGSYTKESLVKIAHDSFRASKKRTPLVKIIDGYELTPFEYLEKNGSSDTWVSLVRALLTSPNLSKYPAEINVLKSAIHVLIIKNNRIAISGLINEYRDSVEHLHSFLRLYIHNLLVLGKYDLINRFWADLNFSTYPTVVSFNQSRDNFKKILKGLLVAHISETVPTGQYERAIRGLIAFYHLNPHDVYAIFKDLIENSAASSSLTRGKQEIESLFARIYPGQIVLAPIPAPVSAPAPIPVQVPVPVVPPTHLFSDELMTLAASASGLPHSPEGEPAVINNALPVVAVGTSAAATSMEVSASESAPVPASSAMEVFALESTPISALAPMEVSAPAPAVAPVAPAAPNYNQLFDEAMNRGDFATINDLVARGLVSLDK